MIFLFFALVASPDWPDVHRIWNIPMGRADIIFQFELLIFFYLNFYILLDRFFFKRKYLCYFLIVAGFLILAIPVMETVLFRLWDHGGHPHHGPARHMRANPVSMFLFKRKLYLFLIITFVSLLIKLRLRLRAAEKEKISTELSFLKAQVNPHFLFNTLNSIYSLSLVKSDAAPDAIVKLSSMMRYVLHDAQEDLVPLRKEINYLKDYIELQKLRLPDSVVLKADINGNFDDQRIAPLILISFLENAFKYGVNSEEKSEIYIRIILVKNTVEFTVSNRKVNTTVSADSKTKLGLINTKKRLELIYPSKHLLTITDTETEFKVDLSINLDA